jgi:hypothetical protein
MRRIGGILVGHGIIVEASIFAGRDEIGRIVDDTGIGGLIPQATDIPLALQAVEGDATLTEGLGGGEPRGPRADNADLIGIALYIHASHIHLPGPPQLSQAKVSVSLPRC